MDTDKKIDSIAIFSIDSNFIRGIICFTKGNFLFIYEESVVRSDRLPFYFLLGTPLAWEH